MRKFPLGRTVITVGAQDVIENAGQTPDFFLDRHVRGDWGDVCKSDKAANDRDLKEGGRLISAYKTLAGIKIWVITEWDRSVTTILLPSEY